MRNKVIDLLDQTIEELDKEKIDGILEIPPKDDMGDFAFPCFQLAKVFRKAPNMIATEIAEKIPASEDVSKVEAMGPYVNFFLNKENYVKEVLAKVLRIIIYKILDIQCGSNCFTIINKPCNFGILYQSVI